MSGTKLYEASGNGDVEAVKSILEGGAIPQLSDDDIGNALNYAALKGHREVMAILLEKIPSLNGDHLGFAIIHAASENQIEALNFLMKEGPTYGLAGIYIGVALIQAAFKGHIEFVKILLESTPTLQLDFRHFESALHHAAFEGHEEVVTLLLEELPSFKDQGAGIALGYAIQEAASENKIEVMKILLKEGPAYHIPALLIGRALDSAASKGHVEAVNFLLKEGPSFNLAQWSVVCALTHAASRGYNEVTKILLEAEPDFELRNGYLRPEIEDAASKGYIQAMKIVIDDMKVVNILLGAGEVVRSSEDANYGTALDIASRFGLTKVVKILSEAGADFDVLREHLQAIPHHTFNGNFEIMKRLVEAGANIGSSNEANYETALNIASRFGLTEVVKALIKEGANVSSKSILAAVAEGHIEIVNILLEEEDDSYMREEAFLAAMEMRQTEVAEEILKKGGFGLDDCDDYRLALVTACRVGQIEIVKMLLEKRNNVNRIFRGIAGTPVTAACEGENPEIVKLLIGKGIDVRAIAPRCSMSECTICTVTALEIAQEKGNDEIKQLLLAALAAENEHQ